MNRNTQQTSDETKQSPSFAAPAISLPKGGGAIRGIGEKFAANPVTGTGSMTVPIATSPGRSGFGPQLALSYDSGAGNGPFGFGWNLSLPAITRKTDKGLPQYRDAEESDVFILSGAEDLVPEFEKDTTGSWVMKDGRPVIYDKPRMVDRVTYTVRRYRPRIEGLFARIERWTNIADPRDVHWHSLSKDNILTIYGQDETSRIADPEDAGRIFSWLICETRDDKGNAVIYEYKPEDDTGIDLTQTHERNRRERDDSRRAANRYLKRIRYGNRAPLLDNADHRPHALTSEQRGSAGWMFEVVFDYGEHDLADPKPNDSGDWRCRQDPFSSYRAGFEVRSYRLCRRVLMFHHFPDEAGVDRDCLVRSTAFYYRKTPIAAFVIAVTQSGYKRVKADGYFQQSLPPLKCKYSKASIGQDIQDVDLASIENLPAGVDGAAYQWVDLDGEGLSGVLTEQGGGWFYKRNESALAADRMTPGDVARFSPVAAVARIPGGNPLTGARAQFLDLAGDGQVDVVELDRPMAGFYERTDDQDWESFRPFTSLPNLAWNDPNLKFVDLTGDGHADVLITENEVFTWYPSLAEDGFGPANRVSVPTDEERGPRVVFADGTQTIFLADLSGDGLTDLARIRNGEVCYWPNLGYGRFGAKVTMDDAPWFDAPDQFDPRRIRLADIDGSGTTDLIYLGRNQTRFWFNQCGNSWGAANELPGFPPVDNVTSVAAVDLLGNGTACLVWSSPLPGASHAPMKYLKLMANGKPHLLIGTRNNLGAETRVHYVPSTYFYLRDQAEGRPWITKLPFPVHVVERVETYDHISRNRFVTRYAYHHGYFDGEEREFRGFGMVEQWDTEEFAALAGGQAPAGTNIDASSHVPPVLTRTWFHTGVYDEVEEVSQHFAAEYYGAPKKSDPNYNAAFDAFFRTLLPDTVIPPNLTLEEEREACRALKGSMLRQEVYALDGVGVDADYPYGHPYTVTEQNFTVSMRQPRGANRHAVFFAHPREALTYHYERNPDDPRVQHALTLEVDEYGNVLKSLAIGYGRGQSPLPEQRDRDKQTTTLITYTENRFTNAIDDAIQSPNDYRTPLPAETRTYELTGLTLATGVQRFSFAEVLKDVATATPLDYEKVPTPGQKQKRLIEHVRTLYRKDDLTALLPLDKVEPLALPGESYKLAFTSGLVAEAYGDPAIDAMLKDEGRYVHSEGDGNWWIPAGRVFYSDTNHTAVQELAEARSHCFLPRRYRDPFGQNTVLTYDDHNLLVIRTCDALNNIVTAANDYRVLQPRLVTDPNGNRTEVAFDALGLVVATAVMGKEGEKLGDLLKEFDANPALANPALATLQDFAADPKGRASSLLSTATTRIIYDLDRYQRVDQPPFAATLARETHFYPTEDNQTRIQISFSYSDGFGREIQKKIQAEEGKAPQRQADVPLPKGDIRPGDLKRDQGTLVQANTPHRWVGSGRTVFNNKGKPVKQYEPFFSATHLYEPERDMTDTGVSPVLFYDPVERVVATLHPNDTYEKVVFDPWQQTTWDVNDTIRQADTNGKAFDPKDDPDVGQYFERLLTNDYLPTWYGLRTDPGSAAEFQKQYPDLAVREQQTKAAQKATAHADTPTTAHFDTLGRTFLTIADNGKAQKYHTRVELDIKGNQREVIDAKDRIVMRYDYDLLGNRIHQASMEAGERCMLNDVTGKPIRTWDSRGFQRRMTYDGLRRPTGLYVTENGAERLAERTVYGEDQGDGKNHRTRVYQVYDGAGIVTSVAYDFKGNLREGRRELLPDYKQSVNWLPEPNANDGSYTSATTYDALNRPLTVTSPDGSVYRPIFNEANLLDKVDVTLRGASKATPFVTNIDYDAKGQRTRIDYGNGASTFYDYDPLTFRLIHLRTVRAADNAKLQDLSYTYDPVGNITNIRDAAQQAVFFNGQVVRPDCDYSYDALYRLVSATGREHIGQLGKPETTWNDEFRVNLQHPHNGQAMRNYTEQYVYDAVGNFEKLIHQAAQGDWTRGYTCNEASLTEPANKKSNRLSSTTVGATTETYAYDAHGNMTAMPHLPLMEWDFKDQLSTTSRQVVNDTPPPDKVPETTYYVYDASGQRVRKVTERQNGTRKEERIYLGGFEIYREFNGNGNDIKLKRETLHIMDDKQRIALVETRTQGNDGSPAQLIRFQFGNHLGSASLELDEKTDVISYEEYYPYGCTSYQAVDKTIKAAAKRYRYTGKERDEESGLYYHGARYYAAWIAKWVSPDPELWLLFRERPGTRRNLRLQLNPFLAMASNPIAFVDLDGQQDTAYTRYLDRQFATVEGARQVHESNRALGEAVLNWGRNIIQGIKQQWKEGTTSDRVELAATGVGTAAGVVPYAGDYVSLGSSVVAFGAKPSWSNAGAVGLDAVGAALPFVPALGTLKRAEKLAEAAKDAEKLAEAAKEAEKLGEAAKEAEKLAEGAEKAAIKPAEQAAGMTRKSEYGTYTNTHESGNTYSGKGGRKRSQDSGREKATEYSDPHTSTDWTPAESESHQSFDEALRIYEGGGKKSTSNYNKIETGKSIDPELYEDFVTYILRR